MKKTGLGMRFRVTEESVQMLLKHVIIKKWEDIIESEYIVINDLILIEHLRDLTGIQLALAYYTSEEKDIIRSSDCDSIATCFYRNEEDYE